MMIKQLEGLCSFIQVVLNLNSHLCACAHPLPLSGMHCSCSTSPLLPSTLELDAEGLTGTLPTSIGALTALRCATFPPRRSASGLPVFPLLSHAQGLPVFPLLSQAQGFGPWYTFCFFRNLNSVSTSGFAGRSLYIRMKLRALSPLG